MFNLKMKSNESIRITKTQTRQPTDFLQQRLQQQQQHTATANNKNTNRRFQLGDENNKKKPEFFWTENCRTFIKINVHFMSLFSWQSPRAVETFWRIWSKHIFQKLWMYKQWVCACRIFRLLLLSSLRFGTEIFIQSKGKPSYAVLHMMDVWIVYVTSHTTKKNTYLLL